MTLVPTHCRSVIAILGTLAISFFLLLPFPPVRARHVADPAWVRGAVPEHATTSIALSAQNQTNAFFVSTHSASTHLATCGKGVFYRPQWRCATNHAAPPAPSPLAIRAAPLHRASPAAIPEIRAHCTNSVPALRPHDCESLRVARASQLLKWRRHRDLHLLVKLLLPARKGFPQEKRSSLWISLCKCLWISLCFSLSFILSIDELTICAGNC